MATPRKQLRDNAILLAILALLPRLAFVKKSYWAALSVTYRWIGNDLDVFVSSALYYLGWVAYIICVANIATSLIEISVVAPKPAQRRPLRSVSMPVKSSPKTRPSVSLPGPISPGKRGFSPATPARMSPGGESPLRNAIAAARSAGSSRGANPSSPGGLSSDSTASAKRSYGIGKSLPSTPASQVHGSGRGLTQQSREATPLDAFKARHPSSGSPRREWESIGQEVDWRIQKLKDSWMTSSPTA
ncbi:hypothetical protein K437DRAFT_255913 [Tilletiaria anomala UBC 951]|uniref:Uncharacterized protein n=1 Tax=Tilletiaria anomala (strain ATCC 24038 / CBS 436.72 / UBC 951) TaxID=1037660 RepID=A0A066W0Y8_TILAU|nr:uncharacterized protein K437DRAFT_255913 [Tilletiaria anomala UBC 951]KDN47366.1 hypothetical protein K437DRAFT_255913 [Tilletiaria anomala UBC 951]